MSASSVGAFGFDRDHRRADIQDGPGRDLDFEDAPLDRADHLGVPPELSGELLHLPARLVETKFGLLDLALALGLEIGFLRPELEDFVLGILPALARIRQVRAGALRRRGACVKPFVRRPSRFLTSVVQILDALLRRLDDLVEGLLELCEVLGLRGELELDLRFEIGVLALALADRLRPRCDGAARSRSAQFGRSPDPATRDRRPQPRSRQGVPAAADTASTTRPPPLIRMPSAGVRVGMLPTTLHVMAVPRARRMTKPSDPVDRPGDADEMIQLFRRCGALQRDGTEGSLRLVVLAHVALTRTTDASPSAGEMGTARACRAPHGLAGSDRQASRSQEKYYRRAGMTSVKSVAIRSNWRNG